MTLPPRPLLGTEATSSSSCLALIATPASSGFCPPTLTPNSARSWTATPLPWRAEWKQHTTAPTAKRRPCSSSGCTEPNCKRIARFTSPSIVIVESVCISCWIRASISSCASRPTPCRSPSIAENSYRGFVRSSILPKTHNKFYMYSKKSRLKYIKALWLRILVERNLLYKDWCTYYASRMDFNYYYANIHAKENSKIHKLWKELELKISEFEKK
jgi:hypothetical protein